MENESHSVHIYVDSISLSEEFILSRACLMIIQIPIYLKLTKWTHSTRLAPFPQACKQTSPEKTLSEVPVIISLNANVRTAFQRI